MTDESILKTLNNNISTLKSFGVARIGLFGSFSRTEQTEASDIDFIVTFMEGRKTFDNYMDLRFYLEELFPNKKIDLVIHESVKPSLKPYIEKTIHYAS